MTKEPVRLSSSERSAPTAPSGEVKRTGPRAPAPRPSRAPQRPSAPALGPVAKGAIAALAGATLGASVYGLAESAHSKHPTPVAELPIVMADAQSASHANKPQPTAAPAAKTEPEAKPVASEAAAPADPEQDTDEEGSSGSSDPRFAAEKALLRSAQAKLRSGDTFGAQTTLDQMKKRFPRGALSQQREILYIQTQKALGATAAAKKSARAFALAHPNSPHLPALEKLLLEP